MTDEATTYPEYRWLEDVQRLEPAIVDELSEIEQIARAINEVSQEQTEFYTTSSCSHDLSFTISRYGASL
jgi:hypothetical protein